MYTEILRIIEGGLSKDSQKVYNYAKILADKMSRDGETKMSKMILDSLERRYTSMLSLDELSSTPVDAESRMSIVDVYCPTENEIKPFLPELTAHKVDDFINMIKHQGDLYKNGVEFSNTLMLYGVPGCGKSTVAKYIAQQIGLPLVIARLDALVSSLLGSTSKNIRKVFDFADSRPCILFLDEFDAIAKARDDQHELGELKRVINSLLQTLTPFQAAAYLSLPQTMRICSTKLFGDVSTLFSKLVSQGKKRFKKCSIFSLVISRQPYQLKMTGKCPNLYLHLLNMATCLRQIFRP